MLPLSKVDGTQNPADLFTKNLARKDVDTYVVKLGMYWSGGGALEGRGTATCIDTIQRLEDHWK